MKIPARVFCSRIPIEIAIVIAITLALPEYSSQRHQANPSSSWRQYQNQHDSNAPAISADRWKKAEMAKKMATRVA